MTRPAPPPPKPLPLWARLNSPVNRPVETTQAELDADVVGRFEASVVAAWNSGLYAFVKGISTAVRSGVDAVQKP